MIRLILIVLIASCGGGAPTKEESASRPPVTSASPVATTSQVPSVLSFKAPRLGGGEVVGSELQGKDLAVWFWAPW